MSVRATERLVSDVVTVTELSNSPRMVVLSVDPENKTVKTVWFSDTHESQQGIFPAAALDRVEPAAAPEAKPSKVSGKTVKGK
jgi:hypothetical protein